MNREDNTLKRIKNLKVTGAVFAALAILLFACGRFGNDGQRAIAADATGTPTVTVTPSVIPSATPSGTPSPTPVIDIQVTGISAYYLGDTPVVGDKIEKENVYVTVYYNSGISEVIKSGYTLVNDTMTTNGINKVAVFYKTFQTTLYVTARELSSITAYTKTSTVSAGNALDKNDVVVTAYYSDSTYKEITDYELEAPAPQAKGTITGVVRYKTKYATFTYYARDAVKPAALYAEYTGTDVVAGGIIDRLKVDVKAIYADSTTERITTYTLGSVPNAKGEQSIKVSYMGVETTFKVNCVEKKAVSLKALYTGRDIVAGNSISKKDLIVTATYNDGSTEVITDYTMYSRVVSLEGENELRVYYEDVQATFFVTGVASREVDFSAGPVFNIKYGGNTTKVTVGLPVYLEHEAVKVKKISATSTGARKIKRLMRQVDDLEAYIPFTFRFADSDDESELPLYVRLRIPDGFELDYARIYYTPNRKTILADLAYEIIDEETIQLQFKNTGTYILAYVITEEVDYEVDEDGDEDED